MLTLAEEQYSTGWGPNRAGEDGTGKRWGWTGFREGGRICARKAQSFLGLISLHGSMGICASKISIARDQTANEK